MVYGHLRRLLLSSEDIYMRVNYCITSTGTCVCHKL